MSDFIHLDITEAVGHRSEQETKPKSKLNLTRISLIAFSAACWVGIGAGAKAVINHLSDEAVSEQSGNADIAVYASNSTPPAIQAPKP